MPLIWYAHACELKCSVVRECVSTARGVCMCLCMFCGYVNVCQLPGQTLTIFNPVFPQLLALCVSNFFGPAPTSEDPKGGGLQPNCEMLAGLLHFFFQRSHKSTRSLCVLGNVAQFFYCVLSGVSEAYFHLPLTKLSGFCLGVQLEV